MFIGRSYGGSSARSRPSSMIVPEVGVSKPASMRSSVVLPQPDEPSRANTSPLAMSMRDVVDGAVAVEVLDDVPDLEKGVGAHRHSRHDASSSRRSSGVAPHGARGGCSVLRLQHVGDRADRLVDVRFLDDQRRRQGDDVAGRCGSGRRARSTRGRRRRRACPGCPGSTRARSRRPGRCCGCRSRAATRAANGSRARTPAPSSRRASAGLRRRRSRACRARRRRRADAPSRCSRAGTRSRARGRS